MRRAGILDRAYSTSVAHVPESLKTAARPAMRRLRQVRARAHMARAVFRGDAHVDARSDEQFVADMYQLALGRPADPSGLRTYADALGAGMSREELVVLLSTSEESINKHLADAFSLQSLKEVRPEAFHDVLALDGSRHVSVVEAATPDDFDWLERSILDYGYYEKPGIWTFAVDDDKRRMGELLSLFAPSRALEIGCSSGAVLSCLRSRGVDAEGVDISVMATLRAEREVRPHIHVGDVLTLDLPGPYDLVYGLDIFEHFNPNRLDRYIERVIELVSPGGFVYVNAPTWGEDRVYGTIWDPYLPSWVEDVNAGRLFHELEVDDDGYPMMGHLVWAPSSWWEERFTRAGLRRELELERALHARFDAEMEWGPARKAFYVFSREATPARIAAVQDRVAASTSVR